MGKWLEISFEYADTLISRTLWRRVTGTFTRERIVTIYSSCCRLYLLFLPMFTLSAVASTTNNWPNNQVSGTITFQGVPLAGVTVTAFNTNTSTITQVTTTDENGQYALQLPAWLNTAGTAAADYHIWAIKPGYAFYPSVGSGATVTRADHTGDFQGNGVTDIAIYFTVIHYIALPNMANRGIAGPPLAGANFTAYDGSNPLVSVSATTGPTVWQGRFTDNQDGTITDHLTGLVWLKNAGCFTAANWGDALADANSLASGACGLNDGSTAGQWRLPNINELDSLVDVSAANPALPAGHPFLNVSTETYWSSTSYFGGEYGSPNAWAIRFRDGRFINDGASNSKLTAANQIWPVKGGGGGAISLQSTGQYVTYTPGDDGSSQTGVPLTFPRWIDKGDGTVADTVTGLVWLKQADCIHQNWAGALAAVKTLADGQCGLSDGSQQGSWRMPTRTEMQSLSDRMENNHADFFTHTYLYPDGSLFQTALFHNFFAYQYYWTSTGDAADSTKVWTVFSCDFGVYDTPRESVGYSLAVRGNPTPDSPRRGAGLVRSSGGLVR